MKNLFTGFRIGIIGACLTAIMLFAGLFFLSEKSTEAEKSISLLKEQSKKSGNNNQEIYLAAFERLRNEYSNVKSIEMEADVQIEILKKEGTVSGTGKVKYIAKNNQYKYISSVSENIHKEGFMRDLDIVYDGKKFFMFDHESKILSYQEKEDLKMPSALPNPFFLPVEFFSRDDDGCPNCKLRLQDINVSPKWLERVNSVSEVRSDRSNEIINNDIKMSGGSLNNTEFEYLVKFVGFSTETVQPLSIAKVKKDGNKLVEILLNSSRKVEGVNMEIPHSIRVVGYDETGRVNLSVNFEIKRLRINHELDDKNITPDFDKVERVWDSDTKTFVKQ